MRVHRGVAGAGNLEVEPAVATERVEHVIEEGDAGFGDRPNRDRRDRARREISVSRSCARSCCGSGLAWSVMRGILLDDLAQGRGGRAHSPRRADRDPEVRLQRARVAEVANQDTALGDRLDDRPASGNGSRTRMKLVADGSGSTPGICSDVGRAHRGSAMIRRPPHQEVAIVERGDGASDEASATLWNGGTTCADARPAPSGRSRSRRASRPGRRICSSCGGSSHSDSRP